MFLPITLGMAERRLPTDEAEGPSAVCCRHCLTWQPIQRKQVDVVGGRVWHRCIDCEEWFLIRRGDASVDEEVAG